MASDLFGDGPGGQHGAAGYAPLADRLRPKSLSDVVGQDHLLGDGPLGRMLASGQLQSLIFWGPPGTGKTTIARLLAGHAGLEFEQLSAIVSGVADLRKVFARADDRHRLGQQTLLFVDEIHRFNRAQQDSFLPYVEQGTVILVGATTENPSFELNRALLSRMQVLTLNRLDSAAQKRLLGRAEDDAGVTLPLTEAARDQLIHMADGDGRFLLNSAEALFAFPADAPLEPGDLPQVLSRRAPGYDKGQDAHYGLISAVHKSMRGSDVDAALYWTARMLKGGEDPHYILRRLIRFASEDVGLADPQALSHTLACAESYDRLGSPEGELAVMQAVIYLATAPKSNAAYRAQKAAYRAAEDNAAYDPPKFSLNAPTKLMRDMGFGEGYAYDHDTDIGVSGQSYFPDGMPRASYYQPVERGFERDLAKRLAFFEKIRRAQDGGE